MPRSRKIKPQLPPERLLDGIPQRNRAVELERQEEGPVLWTKVRRRWWMKAPFSWIMPYRRRKGFRLDTVGLEIWEACDGTHTVENIIDEFAERHSVLFHEARISVMQFIQAMIKRELVAVVIESKGESSE